MKDIQKTLWILAMSLAWISCQDKSPAVSEAMPNIIWLVSEDNSVHYSGLYRSSGADMPNISSLASQGILYENAFSNAPVCSVARSTLISGCYASRIGAQYHRRMELAPMPDGLEMFPAYLREAGYYTTNNSKEDYNLIKSDSVWDESSRNASYKNRSPGQPFFHVQNFGTTHEGKLHFSQDAIDTNEALTNLDEVELFPYQPNTETFTYTHAYYQDLHKKVDDEIGSFLDEVNADGLMENTFIFYYGDHGGVLPRSKGYIYETGVHVPLVVYVPPRYRHLVQTGPGGRSRDFVQFVDFGPTVLSLAGINTPEEMDGRPFLGKYADLSDRDEAFFYADRFDEKYDLVRGVRKGKFKYLRNYQPFNIDGLYNFYRYKMLAYQEWQTLYNDGKLNTEQAQFFNRRSPEALFDLEKDPFEVNNLAHDPSYVTILDSLRETLRQFVKSQPDLSFFPEPIMLEDAMENPLKFGQENKENIASLIDVADLALLAFEEARPRLKMELDSDDPWHRYWAWIVCNSFGEEAAEFFDAAARSIDDEPERLVKMRAIEFLALHKNAEFGAALRDVFYDVASEAEANLVLNTAALIKMESGEAPFKVDAQKIDEQWIDKPNDLVNRRMEYLNQ